LGDVQTLSMDCHSGRSSQIRLGTCEQPAYVRLAIIGWRTSADCLTLSQDHTPHLRSCISMDSYEKLGCFTVLLGLPQLAVVELSIRCLSLTNWSVAALSRWSSLEGLHLTDDSATDTLNLRPLSGLMGLQELRIDSCPGLRCVNGVPSYVTQLRVENNAALKTLDVVSRSSSLCDLRCHCNALTSLVGLDCSRQLTQLNLANNRMSVLDLGGLWPISLACAAVGGPYMTREPQLPAGARIAMLRINRSGDHGIPATVRTLSLVSPCTCSHLVSLGHRLTGAPSQALACESWSCSSWRCPRQGPGSS
jgi:hypothetical protein